MLCVIDEGGYGADASAPVVAETFNYLVRPPGPGAAVEAPTKGAEATGQVHEVGGGPKEVQLEPTRTSLVVLGELAHGVPGAKRTSR